MYVEEWRAVEIRGNSQGYGSGYRVGGRLVLTAAHVVGGAGEGCRVRPRGAGVGWPGAWDGAVVWTAAEPGTVREGPSRLDVALVELGKAVGDADPVTFGRFPEQPDPSPVPFEIYGWPCWARTQGEGSVLAGGRQIPGLIYPADTSPEGLLVVEPDRAPDPGELCGDAPGSSAWEGVSGAAVVCDGGLVVAVQRHHQNPRRQRSLEAVLLEPFLDDEGFCRVFRERGLEVLVATVADPATPLGKYLQAAPVRFEAEFADRIDHLVPLSYSEARDRFMAVLARERPGETVRQPRVGSLEDLAPKPGQLALLSGPGGSGKSTSLLDFALSSARAAQTGSRLPVPLYARLASFDARERGFAELLEVVANAAGLTVEEVGAFWRQSARPGIFLLDGLNEVNAEFSDTCLKAVRELTAQPAHAYLISSRPGPVLDELARATKARVLELVALDRERIEGFLQAQGMAGLADQLSPDLWSLAQNPFMLWAIHRTMGEGKDQPHLHGRGELYRQLIEDHLFAVGEQAASVDYNYTLVKKPVLAQMAYDMSIAGATRAEESDEFLSRVEAELDHQADVNRSRTRLRPRIFMPDPPVPGELIDEIVSNGLLTRSGSQLEFWHQSVQEYYTAEQLQKTEMAVGNLLATLPTGQEQYEKESLLAESVVVLAGLLPAADQLVSGLSEQHPFLAARCLKEAPEVSPAVVDNLRRRWLAMVSSHHEEQRRQGARYLGAAGFTADRALAKRLTELFLQEGDYRVRDALADALAAGRSPQPLHDLLVALFADDGHGQDSRGHAYRAAGAIGKLATVDDVEATARKWLATSGTEQEDLADQLGLLEDRLWSKPVLPALRRLREDAEKRGDDDASSRLEFALAHVPEWLERAQRRWPNVRTAADLRQMMKRVWAAADGMGRRSETEVLDALADEASGVRRAAADELARRKPTTSIEPLVNAMWREDTWNALRSLLKAMHDIDPAAASRLLADDVTNERSATSLRSAIALDWLGTSGLDESLCEALRQESAAFRAAAAVSLGRSHADNAVACLADALRGEVDEDVLAALVGALGYQGSPEAVDLLLSLTLDAARRRDWRGPPSRGHESGEQHGWQEEIRQALVSTGRRPEVVQRLTLALEDEPAVRAAAISELSAWPPLEASVVRRIRQAVAEDPDPAIRAAAAYSSIRLASSPREADLVIDLVLRADQAEVHYAAVQALGTRKNTESIDALIRMAAAEQDDRMVHMIGEVLGGQDRSIVSPKLLQAIESDDESQACRSAILLGGAISVGKDSGEQQLGPLIEAAGDRGSLVLLAALSGYMHDSWKSLPKFVLSRLVEIAWHDPLQTARIQAAECLLHSWAEDDLYEPIRHALTEGRYDDVLQLIGPVDESPFLPDDANLYWWRAVALEHLSQDGPAQRDIDKVVSLGYDFADLRLLAARIHERNGDFAAALSEAQQAVITDPGSASAHNDFGWYKLKLGHSGAAAQEFSHALNLRPHDAAIRFNLGLALLATGQGRKADAAYQGGIERLEAETSHAVLRGAITDLEELQPGGASDRKAILQLLRTHLSTAAEAKAADNQ